MAEEQLYGQPREAAQRAESFWDGVVRDLFGAPFAHDRFTLCSTPSSLRPLLYISSMTRLTTRQFGRLFKETPEERAIPLTNTRSPA
jgi:hypothetical protein